MKIAIVNDQLIAVEALKRAVAKKSEWTLSWIARDGAEAVQHCAADRPDLILMDLIMPVMDGVEATRKIMQDSPCGVLVVTSSVDANFSKVFEAMGHGALDAVNTPAAGNDAELITKIDQMSRRIKVADHAAGMQALSGSRLPALSGSRMKLGASAGPPPLLAIGASTGGPQAVSTVLAAIPKDFSMPIVVIQHMGAEFTAGLASWLHEKSGLPATLAVDGMELAPGHVYLSGKDDHLTLQADGKLHYTPDPKEYPYRPSVDVFFRSARKYCHDAGMAVLLTGMGRDGAAGLLELKTAGWFTVAQDKSDCVVYGMPKAAAELGAATEIHTAANIGHVIALRWKTYFAMKK